MMNKDLIYVIEQIGREKGISKEVLFEALESALLSASKKTMGAADNVRMQIDRQTGTLRVFARKKVVDAEAALQSFAKSAHKATLDAVNAEPVLKKHEAALKALCEGFQKDGVF